ncbi:MAG TPA: virulence factor SrfC family protein [Candidatus Rifleibacterium sp.]|nr:virulence factor SrfC family protein [Candidatus Rifleibacterium sp.]
MNQSKMRPEEQQIVTMSDQLTELLNCSSGWAAGYLKDAAIRKFMDKILQEKQVTVRRIKESAQRPVALGVFGASQCGKSYLTSELVRGGEASLSVLLNGLNQNPAGRDYLEEINPAGGRESTALVTRFTTRPYRTVQGCSAFLRLLTITDLIKIFLNGFLFECQSDFVPTADELQKLRYSFRGLSGRSGGSALLTEADVWDLQDYARRHFHNQFLRMLEDINYWGILNDEIRLLPADQQISYLEWLWGRFPKITELFRFLQKELGNLGGEVVGIYDDSLLPRTNSIIDVQRLSQLMKVGNRKVALALNSGGQVSMDSSTLCALTAELILQTASTSEESLLRRFDVLDFPGARARAQVFDQQRLTKDHEALVEVYLRGKVAYLFDRYSDDRDVTALLLCQEGGPQEAKSLPYMVNKWVEWSQGKEPAQRKGKTPLLFHVFTKFDMDLVRKRGEDPSVRWDSRLKTNFADFMGRAGSWVTEWEEGRAFQNCYWVRNPGVQQTVFGRDKDGKEFVRDEEQLAEIMAQYLGNENVQRHFADAKEAWSRAAAPGQSGIQYLVERLKAGIETDAKVKQLQANLRQIFAELKTHLQPYFIGDDISHARKMAEERAKKLLLTLGKGMATRYSLPRILDLDRFSISDKTVGMIFDSVVNPMESEEGEAAEPSLVAAETSVFDESIFSVGEPAAPTAETVAPKKAVVRRGEVFAQAVMNRWQAQLAYLSQDAEFQELTGLPAEWFAETTQELIKGASRMKIESAIAGESDQIFNAPNPGRFLRKASARAATALNRYITCLGQEMKETPVPSGPPKATLSARAYPGLAIYQHWTSSLLQLFKDNVAEASADDEASNRELEKILKAPFA